LPGVVHLEFVRHAAMLLQPDSPDNNEGSAGLPSAINPLVLRKLILRNVGWVKPIIMAETGQALDLTVNIKPESSSAEERVFGFELALGTGQGEGADDQPSGYFTGGSI
ncbi:hypothetical protein KKI93_24800, partial [Xenorhabdus bovienii]|uniref:hypothetical protein n=1 Tax=Xenorhabdus bovienii TaxID=40576 RepID=UPI0023B341BE